MFNGFWAYIAYLIAHVCNSQFIICICINLYAILQHLCAILILPYAIAYICMQFRNVCLQFLVYNMQLHSALLLVFNFVVFTRRLIGSHSYNVCKDHQISSFWLEGLFFVCVHLHDNTDNLLLPKSYRKSNVI